MPTSAPPNYYFFYKANLADASPHLVDIFFPKAEDFFENLGDRSILWRDLYFKNQKAVFIRSGELWRIDLSDADNPHLEGKSPLNNILDLSNPNIYMIKHIKDNKIYIFTEYKDYLKFHIVDITDLNNPQKLGELSLENRSFDNWGWSSNSVVVDDSYCYIITNSDLAVLFETWFESYLQSKARDFVTLNISDPNYPLFVSKMRITITPFDKKDIENNLVSKSNMPEFSPHILDCYNGYYFIEGTVPEDLSDENSAYHSRLFVIDTSRPTEPILLGYINFPYIIMSMNFAHNSLYVAADNSIIYQYDFSKIVPAHPATSSGAATQTEETEESLLTPEEENTSGNAGDGADNEKSNTESNNEEPTQESEVINEPKESVIEEAEKIATEDGEQNNEQEQSLSVIDTYQPLPGPSWLSYSNLWNINSVLNTAPNQMLFPVPVSDNVFPYYYPHFFLFTNSYLSGSNISSLKNWYVPALPFMYLDYFIDHGLGIGLPADYPAEVLPNLVYHLYGLKIEHAPEK